MNHYSLKNCFVSKFRNRLFVQRFGCAKSLSLLIWIRQRNYRSFKRSNERLRFNSWKRVHRNSTHDCDITQQRTPTFADNFWFEFALHASGALSHQHTICMYWALRFCCIFFPIKFLFHFGTCLERHIAARIRKWYHLYFIFCIDFFSACHLCGCGFAILFCLVSLCLHSDELRRAWYRSSMYRQTYKPLLWMTNNNTWYRTFWETKQRISNTNIIINHWMPSNVIICVFHKNMELITAKLIRHLQGWKFIYKKKLIIDSYQLLLWLKQSFKSLDFQYKRLLITLFNDSISIYHEIQLNPMADKCETFIFTYLFCFVCIWIGL